MPELKVRNWKNEEVRPIGVAEGVFDAPMREALVHQAVHHYTAARRAGTASTKGRGDVSGSGRKLWRQKKTGRARVGSIRSPLWRKGGTVHGPTPRDYDYHLPRKMRKGALRSVVSQRLREGNLVILESLELPTHKTRDLLERLRGLGLDRKTALFVDENENRNLRLAARNLPNVHAVPVSGINVYDVLACQYLLLSEAAAVQLGERLSG